MSSTSFTTSNGDVYGVHIDATTITLVASILVDSVTLTSTKADGFVAGLAIESSGSSSISSEMMNMIKVADSSLTAEIVKGLYISGPLLFISDCPLQLTDCQLSSPGDEVKGIDIQVTGIATISDEITASGGSMNCTSDSGKVTGVEVNCGTASFVGMAEYVWSVSNVVMQAEADIDGLVVSASNVANFVFLQTSLSGESLTSVSGLVRGVVWDFGADFTTTTAKVLLDGGVKLISNGTVKGWDLNCPSVSWTSTGNGEYKMDSVSLLGDSQAYGFYVVTDNFNSGPTGSPTFLINGASMVTIGDLPSAIVSFTCLDTFDTTGMPFTLTASTVIFMSLSVPSLSLLRR